VKGIHINLPLPGISVIIPVKDPEPYLSQLTANIYRSLKNIDHEILCQYEVGLTNAVIEGVKQSKYDIIAVLDADGSHNPVYLERMMHILRREQYDLVVGSKALGTDDNPFGRRMISKFYCWFASFMLGLSIKEVMSGFVMGDREFFLRLKPSDDYKFLLQLLCLVPSPRVVEFPIHFNERKEGKSKATFRTGVNTIVLILKLWWKRSF